MKKALIIFNVAYYVCIASIAMIIRNDRINKTEHEPEHETEHETTIIESCGQMCRRK